MTVCEVLDWFETVEVKCDCDKSARERRRIRALFRDRYGGLLVGQARPAMLLEFILNQPGWRSNWSKRRVKSTVNRPFNFAADMGLISRNPFRGVKFPEGPEGRDWSAAEFRGLLRNSKAYFRRLIAFLRFSGARPGEARGLLWSEVRDDLHCVVKARHKQAHKNQARRIHYNRVIFKLLLWLRRHAGPTDNVFTNCKGRPWTVKALTKAFAAARVRAGLGVDVKCHGGRHTFGTGAIVNGVDLATLAQLMGHKSIQTTVRYVHLAGKKAHLNAAANKAIS